MKGNELSELLYHPLFGVTVTVAAYAVANRIHRKRKWLHPLFLTSGGLIVTLLLLRIPYEAYKAGGDLIVFFLGPATVALGVPLYKQAHRIRNHMLAVVSGITAGSVSGMLSAGILVYTLGGTREILLSMLPKSVTSPIAIEIARELGGVPELAGVFAVLTGLLGSMIGPEVLRAVGIRGDIPLGTAVGTASHGIGTARIIRESELQGSFSGFAMGLAGIITSILAIPLYWWLH